MGNNEFGLRCPACGNADLINIELKVWLPVSDDEVGQPHECMLFEGYHWEGTDRANCSQCDHTGTVATFQVHET